MQIWKSYDPKHLKVHLMQIEVFHDQPNGFMRFRFLAISSVITGQTDTFMASFDPLVLNSLVSDQFLKFEGQRQALY